MPLTLAFHVDRPGRLRCFFLPLTLAFHVNRPGRLRCFFLPLTLAFHVDRPGWADELGRLRLFPLPLPWLSMRMDWRIWMSAPGAHLRGRGRKW